jgi:hypothetical protein
LSKKRTDHRKFARAARTAAACCALALVNLIACAQELGPPPVAAETDFVPVASGQRKSVSVNAADRSAVVQFYKTVYAASQGIASGWNGDRASCTPGTTSQAYADATILRVNYYRAMTGLPGDVYLTNTWNLKAQQAALMMSKQGALSHSPDTSWACYTADGAEAAGKSNLALGADAAYAIDLYMDDPGSGGNAAVGHRRWILYPPTKVMGAGNIPNTGGWAANDLWVIGGAGTRPAQPAWVAWPPSGYVPYQVMPRSSGRWSFSYPNASLANAAVYMLRLGTNVPVALETQAQGYGDNTIVWVPQGVPSTPVGDAAYSVTVSNVVVSSQSRSFSYTVTIIDPEVPALAFDRSSTNTFAVTWPSTSTGYTLEHNTSLTNSTGWTTVTGVQVYSNNYVATVTNTSGRHFYRLRK